MDPVLYPCSPGAGRPPTASVGRDQQREAWGVSLKRVEAGRTAQPVVLYGFDQVRIEVLAGRPRPATKPSTELPKSPCLPFAHGRQSMTNLRCGGAR